MSFESEYSPEEIRDKLTVALTKLYERDRVLLDIDANERSLTHKLAEYLQVQFEGWHVDCEYNKEVDQVKRLPWKISKHEDGSRVYPDIIVHERKTSNNLLVIEVKKSGISGFDDLEKLREFATNSKFGYKNGIFLELGVSSISVQCFSKEKNDFEIDSYDYLMICDSPTAPLVQLGGINNEL